MAEYKVLVDGPINGVDQHVGDSVELDKSEAESLVNEGKLELIERTDVEDDSDDEGEDEVA